MAGSINIIAYHSQVLGEEGYNSNDHDAFRQDLAAILKEGFRVVRALDVVQCLLTKSFDRLPARSIAITLDDGPTFDVEHDPSGRAGERRSMLALARNHQPSFLGFKLGRPRVPLTSFVIASEEARAQIAGGEDGYLRATWWARAQRSGQVDIGTHSWDHVHPAVREVRERTPHLVEAFHLIDDEMEASKQLVKATRAVRAVTGHEAARLFAYPYGQRSDFLVRDFLPRQSEVLAAFTTEGKPVTADTSRWEIPRYVCNHHWRSSTELLAILRAG